MRQKIETIQVTTGVGEAKTKTAAFDSALKDCGVHNYNLLELSSVIPTGAQPAKVDQIKINAPLGSRLECVIARNHSPQSKTGQISAGIGWHVFKEGGGIFTEEHADTTEKVTEKITTTLDQMDSIRAYMSIESDQMVIETTSSDDIHSVVLVAASYRATPY